MFSSFGLTKLIWINLKIKYCSSINKEEWAVLHATLFMNRFSKTETVILYLCDVFLLPKGTPYIQILFVSKLLCQFEGLVDLHWKKNLWNGTLFDKYVHSEGWSQDCSKSDGCFSQYLISSPWRLYEDYNIFFCKQWKFRCHCSYEQWHLNFHCLQKGQSCP